MEVQIAGSCVKKTNTPMKRKESCMERQSGREKKQKDRETEGISVMPSYGVNLHDAAVCVNK